MENTINVVVDISHHNGHLDFEKAKADGIVGVIHKATQGLTLADHMYNENREKALAAGLLWGAYHFGDRHDGSRQAQHFLDKVNADAQTLLVLDYEPNPAGSTMSLQQARDFVTYVNSVLGRYPGLYSSSLIKEKLGNQTKDPVFSQCFLWIAQYGPEPTDIPPTWNHWTFWQYTDGKVGPEPHEVQGIGKCDRDQFNGTLEELRKLWGVVPAIQVAGAG